MLRRNGILMWCCLLAVSMAAGCGDEETIVLAPTPAIEVAVSATPNSVNSGAVVTVAATTTTASAGPLTYRWTSNAGRFASATDDTTQWTAPDDAGIYTLSLVVTDGRNVAIGGANVAVATYLPTVSPFYRGVDYCATCHNGGSGGDQFTAWSNSAHAGAMAGLRAIGQGDNPFCVDCHTVGSYGLNADEALANGGWDETHVDRLADVQCENCHGAGSDHPQIDPASVAISQDSALCGQCHTDTHHPTYDEWASSPHNHVIVEEATRAACAKCHNGLYTAQYLNNPEGFTNPPANPTQYAVIGCVGCHDPHGNGNPASLRNASVTDRALPNSVLVEKAGAGRLCMACHNGRRTDTNINDQITKGTAHMGPHHSNQGDMLAGVNAADAQLDANFPWSSSKHILVEDACVTCHTHPHAGDPDNGIANFTGHTFAPTVEACAPCHGELSSFAEVMAKQDFDGDGGIEGVQHEVEGLMAELHEVILDASPSQTVRDSLVANFEAAIGDTNLTTRDQRTAAYNLLFVEFDGSKGVHNTTYSVQLLQQSILSLSQTALSSNAFILKDVD